MDGAEAGLSAGPELGAQPIAAEAGATQQGNMELGAPPVAHHCVCEDPDMPRRRRQAQKAPGRETTVRLQIWADSPIIFPWTLYSNSP
jgi:hypothetical protein